MVTVVVVMVLVLIVSIVLPMMMRVVVLVVVRIMMVRGMVTMVRCQLLVSRQRHRKSSMTGWWCRVQRGKMWALR
jgi:hypothetical protein